MSNQQPISTFLGSAAAVVLAISFAVMGGAGVSVQVTETLLDGNAADDFDARISGDNIVFTSNRAGNLDIFRVIEPGVIVALASGAGNQEMADIDGVQVVYVDDNVGSKNIFHIADLTVGVSDIIVANAASDNAPAISGDNVVFVTDRNGNLDIFRYDLQIGLESPLATGLAPQLAPVIDGSLVAWSVIESGQLNIDATELGGTPFPVAVGPGFAVGPSISGDLIAFVEDGDVFLFNRSTGQTTQVTNDPAAQIVTFVEGQNVLWTDLSSGNSDIFLHHLPTGQTFQLTTDASDQILTDVSGNVAVFHDDRVGSLNVWKLEFTIIPLCPADIDCNGVVNVLDLIDLLLCFGQPGVPGCEAEDVNGDGVVNVLDLIQLLLAFGTACP